MLSRNTQSNPDPAAEPVVGPPPTPASTEASLPRRDPIIVLAEQMVSAVLATASEAWEIGRTPGSIVVARVPPGWGEPVVGAWLAIVHGHTPNTAESLEEDEVFSPRARVAIRVPITFVAAVDERNQPTGRMLSEDRLMSAFSIRAGLLVALEGASEAPAALLASADLVLELPHPTGAMLAAVACQVAHGQGEPPSDAVAAKVRPFDVECVLRPGQTADDYLRRLTLLLEVKYPAEPNRTEMAGPVWTLDTLPLAPDVEAWVRQVACDLSAYSAGTLPWTEVDHGALLTGPPGCGKTTLASALAATCGVPLLVTSYATLESGEDGKGRYYDILKNLRATFARARAAAPCILLFDEIDSVPARGEAGHNESWFTPIANALLTETAVEARKGVILLGATNFPNRIDPALRRSGRLDRIVQLDMPSIPHLSRILGAHCPNLAAEALEQAAMVLAGHSGADVARIVRGARRRARAAAREVSAQDVFAELDDGTPARSDKRQRRVSVHEAGHALVTELLRPGAVQAVTLRGSPGAPSVLGRSVATRPDTVETNKEIDGYLMEALAGRAAEELLLGEASAGAMGDLQMATALCLDAEFSMGLGRCLTSIGQTEREEVSRILMMEREIAAAVEERLQHAYSAALSMLAGNRSLLGRLAEALLAAGTLSRRDIEAELGRQEGDAFVPVLGRP